MNQCRKSLTKRGTLRQHETAFNGLQFNGSGYSLFITNSKQLPNNSSLLVVVVSSISECVVSKGLVVGVVPSERKFCSSDFC